MSNTIWSAESGWHNGPEAVLSVDGAGRIRSRPVAKSCGCTGSCTAEDCPSANVTSCEA